jgi:organic radical activating enzyme
MTALRLDDNIINRQLLPDQPKFKIWSSAGLMLTYWCSSRCACCYVFSNPEAATDETEMNPDFALECWRAIRRLAGPRGKIHLTGGEPFRDFDRLENILQRGYAENLGGLEKIETNAFWCIDEKIGREYLSRLKSAGITKLQISTDIYHQEFVPIDRVRLCARLAAEILGPSSLQIRWLDFLSNPVLVDQMNEKEKQKAFQATLLKRGERLLGRAAEQLAPLFPLRNHRDFAELNCARTMIASQHVHIDGAGNVFSGTCIGIKIGNLFYPKRLCLDELWRQLDYRLHPIMSVLAEKGPCGLLPLAAKKGYQPLDGYADKCHLCYHLRRFLYETNAYPCQLGPGICYGNNS